MTPTSGYRPYEPPPQFALITTAAVAIAVEFVRPHLHPDIMTAISHPRWMAAASVLATLVFMLWTMPDTLPKVAVTAFFTSASMFTILAIIVAFANKLVSPLYDAAKGLITGVS